MGSRIRDNVRHLFECFCEVAAGDKDTEPFVRKKYPDSYKNEEELKSLPKFAFPCELDSNVIQRFSFVLTSADSKYTFCFCRYDPNTSSALVIMSHLPWHDVFYKLLSSIASLINKGARGELTAFLDACRIRPPMPGHTLRVTYNSDQSVFTCQSPEMKLPSIPENCNLNEYYSAVDSRCMAGLWAALLNERRVAVVASKPSRLSATVQAANATLYPMAWQHIFIPVLPKHLAEYLLAPMPFLVGVPRSVMETVKMSDIGDVVILDADASTIQSPFNDLDSLPFEVVSGLKRALKNKNELMGDAVSRAFLRALVQLIGGYKEAIRIEKKDEAGVKITFNRDAFVKTRRPALQPFLKKILNLQIFQQFIEERLEVINSGRGFNDEFETECRLYEEESNASSGGLRQQYKEWTKTVKREGGALLKTVKDKANPAVKSAVKSVRQGGKGVRSAVKGLKTRMRDGGHRTHSPRPSSANFIDDSRLSYESTTPVSSGSSDSLQSGSSSRSPTNSPPGLRLDLLNEMEVLLSKSDSAHRSSSLSVNDGSSIFAEISSMDKAKTLSGRMPPRPPARPAPPPRYPIVPTRTLVDVSDAPPPPPRSHNSVRDKVSFFTSHITKDEPNPSAALPRTVNPIQFEPSGKDHKNLTASTSVQNLQNPKKNALSLPKVTRQITQIPNTINGITTSASVKDIIKNANALDKSPGRLPLTIAKSPPSTTGAANKKINRHEIFDSGSDLIQLDVPQSESSPKLEDFDPLKSSGKPEPTLPIPMPAQVPSAKNSADTDLLREYGLDFSSFGLNSTKSEVSNGNGGAHVSDLFFPSHSQTPVAPKGKWTTFQ